MIGAAQGLDAATQPAVLWATSFTGAVAITLLVVRAARRYLVERPAAVAAESGPGKHMLPFAGGLALVAGIVAGAAMGGALASRSGAILLAATAIAVATVAFGRGVLNGTGLLAVCAGACAGTVASGVRIDATGVDVLDVALTVVFLLVAMWAVAAVGRHDDTALVLIVAAIAAGGVFALAVAGDRDATAALAAAIVGASLAFVIHSLDPSGFPLGDAGRLSVGFAVAAAAADAPVGVAAPGSAGVVLLLVGLPLTDLAAVTLARLRRRRSLRLAKGGHLARCLSQRGFAAHKVTAMLAASQVVFATLAVLMGRKVLPVIVGLAAAGVVVFAITATAAKARVYPESPATVPRWVWVVGLAVVGIPIVLSAPAVAAIISTRSQVEAATRAVQDGLEAERKGDTRAAADLFSRARRDFDSARKELDGDLASMATWVPLVSPNLKAVRTLVGSATEVARAGERLTAAVSDSGLRVSSGAVPLDEVRRVAVELDTANETLLAVTARINGISRDFLIAPLRRTLDRTQARLAAAGRASETVTTAARLAPAILGGDGPRSYLLAVQNNAEARATGGLIGDFGELEFSGGSGRLVRFGRIAELIDGGAKQDKILRAPEEYVTRYGQFEPAKAMQNVNMTPDFPTAARVLADLYPQAGGKPVDGVIAVDPFGLAALLQLTGPVPVEGWPEPISARNVVDITIRAAYEAFDNTGRIDFLGDVAEAIAQRVTSGDLGEPARIAFVLANAVRDRHIMMYLTREEEQSLIERIGLAGHLPPIRSDSLMVVNQNGGANKTDFYLHRRLEYAVQVEPDGDRAGVSGQLRLSLDNQAPAEGLPRYVLGPNAPGMAAGENRTFLSLYSPGDINAAALDGARVTLEAGSELGRKVHSIFVSLPAETTRTLTADVNTNVPLTPDGWYEVQIVRQPVVYPDDVTIDITVPAGWRIIDTREMELIDTQRARASVQLESNRSFGVRLERSS